MPRMLLPLLSFSLLFVLSPSARADEPVDYNKQIKPLLKRHCLECHGEKKPRGGLRVDSAEELFKGGDSGKAIVPGHAEKSLFILAIQGKAEFVSKMPYKRTPLKKEELALLVDWINQGAKAAEDEAVGIEDHWAFQAPVRHSLPKVGNADWPRNPIDYFVLAQLEKKNVSPSPEAEKTALLRRVYLDLIGLPPSPEEVEAFLNDTSSNAYEKVVDRLLNSPHYGERWGRHWLDLARYADSHGFTIDAPREIWKYRDWVIEALNKDMPFDQFVVEQIAGDMLPKATISQKIATGFHRNTLINQEGGIDREQFRVDAVADRVDTTGVVFLGLTLGCARCHDHKYDPIKQKEYYELFAFLNNQSEPNLSIATPELVAKREAITKQIEEHEIKLNDQISEYLKKLPKAEEKKIKNNITMILRLRPDQRTEAQKRSLAKFFRPRDAVLKKSFDQLDALKKKLPRFPTTMVLRELSKPRTTHVHINGDFTRKGEVVQCDTPDILHPLPEKKNADRLDLAKWLVDPDNPLTARVTINRVWQRYFGRGIVETENDFGTQGTPPTHPKLLDWLATEFIRRDWSLKAMHKLIVTSATYRQSSDVRPELLKIDPHNKWLARQSRFRLEAEIVRDCALSVSGLLCRDIGGPSVYPPQPDGIYRFTQVKRKWRTSTGGDRYRRGIYTFFQRSAPYPALIVFDAPKANSSCTRRVRSNTPLQALTLLNDKAFLELARGLAHRVLKEAPKSDADRMEYAFRLCLVREPTAWEKTKLLQFFNQQLKQYQEESRSAKTLITGDPASGNPLLTLPGEVSEAERAAWTATVRVLMNLDEFVTRE